MRRGFAFRLGSQKFDRVFGERDVLMSCEGFIEWRFLPRSATDNGRMTVKKLLQVDFDFAGPFGEEMSNMLAGLAESINNEPGMIWKIWTENKEDQLAGGIYLFEDEESARAYLKMHSARLKEMGINEVRGRIFDVNVPLSVINKSPVTS